MLATGNENLVELLKSRDFSLITSFKGRYIDLLKQYYFVGGLPEAVAQFVDSHDFKDASRIFSEFKGTLTEQYVLQQLVVGGKIKPFYWSAEGSTGEIDFVFQWGGEVVPLEVKAAENLQAKSLKNYCAKYKPRQAVRTFLSDYRREEWLLNVPLYAIPVIGDLLGDGLTLAEAQVIR